MPAVVPFIPAIAAGAISIGGAATAVSALKQAHDSKKEAKKQVTPTFDANAEKKKAAMQEAEANRRRALSETDTVRTSALGNAGTTELKKKTLLGG